MDENEIAHAVLGSTRLQDALGSALELVDEVESKDCCSSEQALRAARVLRDASQQMAEAAELVERAVDWASGS